MEKYKRIKHLPFSLMYLLFRQNDYLYCKCGILRHIMFYIKESAYKLSGLSRLWLYLVYFC